MPRSRVTLPKLNSPPSTIADYLIMRFPHVCESTWRDRFSRGKITATAGLVLREDSPYRHGLLVFYEREVPSEPDPAEIEAILYQDSDILVADKPHGMPVTPAGNHVARSLLSRLERSTGLDCLAPLHRLDRDTAGVVLFSTSARSRAPYHDLFSRRLIQREYTAVSFVKDRPERTHWLIENRIGPGTPWFRQRIVEGSPNAITEIELIEVQNGFGRFRLRPQTGRKHQLRVHMASIGFPILGDPLYPENCQPQTGQALTPLQLLAYRIAFTDPQTSTSREFISERTLQMF